MHWTPILDGAPQKLNLEHLEFSFHFTTATLAVLKPDKYRQVESLLSLAGKRAATRERDSVYGLLGLLPRNTQIVPDYTASLELIFEQASFALLQATQNPSLLRFATLDQSTARTLPSWAIDFRTLSPRHLWANADDYNRYEKAEDACRVQARAGVLALQAKRLSTIQYRSDWMFDMELYGHENVDNLKLDLLQWQEFFYNSRASQMAFWWCALDRSSQRVDSPDAEILDNWARDTKKRLMTRGDWHGWGGYDSWSYHSWLGDEDHRSEKDRLDNQFIFDVIDRLKHTRCFVTADGGVGLTKNAAREHDTVVAFAGSANLFVVRSVDNAIAANLGSEVFRLIGLCRWQGKIA